jgi:hypothetical protein
MSMKFEDNTGLIAVFRPSQPLVELKYYKFYNK